jgi:hypothetical protein
LLQAEPPQSIPVSVPFFLPSVQVGLAQSPELHTWLAQSASTAHAMPSAHFEAQEPPQSIPVSF